MATSDILGLFMSPEQYQAQQMAQQQAGEQQRAFNFAGLDPRQQANYGVFLGAQQLGRGIGGLLGVQDPQLQRIRQRQEIMQSINPADPQSLMAGIQRAAQTNDQELALTLTDFMNKQGSEMALAQQRKAQAARERTQALPAGVQEAELIGKLTEELQKTTDPNQRAIIQAKIKRLEKNLTKADELEDLFVAEKEAIAEAQSRAAPSQAVGLDGRPLATQPMVNVDNDPKVKAIRARINTLTATPIDKQLPEVAKATAFADTVSPDRNSPEWKEAYKTTFARLIGDKPSETQFKLEKATSLLLDRDDLIAQGYAVDSKQVREIDAKLRILGTEPKDAKTYEPLVRAERIGVLTDELDALEVAGKKNTPEYRRKAAELKSLQGDKAGAPIKEVVLAEKIVELDEFVRNAKDPTAPDVVDAKTKAQLYRDAMKRERPNIDTLGLAKGGKYDGQPVFLDETSRKTFVFDTDKEGKQIEIPYTGGLKGLKGGTQVTQSVGESKVVVDTGEAGKAAGKELGKELITVKDKQSAIDSIQDALSILKQGIYAGSYSDIRKGLAKYAGIGDPAKVARTEEFVSYIGDVVVARLKDFGGNDSEQELKYLNRIIGGDLEIEPQALKRILERADAKIRRGIERLRSQAESGEKKQSLTTTLPPAEAAPAQRNPTRRFNKTTGKLEVIQ